MINWKSKKGLKGWREHSVSPTANIIKEAPILVLVFKEKDNDWIVGDNLLLGAAIQNICLSATACGLGSLWIRDTVYVQEEIAKLVGYGHLELNSAISIGYADESPKPRSRKSIDEIMKYL